MQISSCSKLDLELNLILIELELAQDGWYCEPCHCISITDIAIHSFYLEPAILSFPAMAWYAASRKWAVEIIASFLQQYSAWSMGSGESTTEEYGSGCGIGVTSGHSGAPWCSGPVLIIYIAHLWMAFKDIIRYRCVCFYNYNLHKRIATAASLSSSHVPFFSHPHQSGIYHATFSISTSLAVLCGASFFATRKGGMHLHTPTLIWTSLDLHDLSIYLSIYLSISLSIYLSSPFS